MGRGRGRADLELRGGEEEEERKRGEKGWWWWQPKSKKVHPDLAVAHVVSLRH